MRNKVPVLHLILVSLLAIPAFVHAGTDNEGHDWAVLTAVQPGEKLFVKLKNGEKIKGVLQSVNDSTLAISNDDENVHYGRQDILEVRLGHGRSIRRSILFGTLIGAGAGAGLGGAAAAADSGYPNDGWLIPAGAAVGAIFGTAVGAVVSLFRGPGDLIYRAAPKHFFIEAE